MTNPFLQHTRPSKSNLEEIKEEERSHSFRGKSTSKKSSKIVSELSSLDQKLSSGVLVAKEANDKRNENNSKTELATKPKASGPVGTQDFSEGRSEGRSTFFDNVKETEEDSSDENSPQKSSDPYSEKGVVLPIKEVYTDIRKEREKIPRKSKRNKKGVSMKIQAVKEPEVAEAEPLKETAQKHERAKRTKFSVQIQ